MNFTLMSNKVVAFAKVLRLVLRTQPRAAGERGAVLPGSIFRLKKRINLC
jgi:hypothetical protein